MRRTDIDRAKLARLRMDLLEKQSALRSLSDLYAQAREHHMSLRAQIARDSERFLDGAWTDRQPVADLLELPPEVLKDARVDLPTARAAVAEAEQMAALQKRMESVRADVAPLARLVESLNRYVEEL